MTDKELVAAARSVRQNAYAPYSKFKVGAAVLTEDGSLFTGCNVENASYGLTICAERVAATAAVAAGHTRFARIALSLSGGGTPCGACRQVLAEFCDDDTPVLIDDADQTNVVRTTYVNELLPDRFQFDS